MTEAANQKLTWAIPIEAEQLLASVEAYTTLLPTLLTLRLCHRFGKDAHITKLPIDVLSMIEDLLDEEVEPYLLEWRQRFRCLRNGDGCWQTVEGILSHVSDEEVQDLSEYARDCECEGLELPRAGLTFKECQCQWEDLFQCSDVLSTHEELRDEVRNEIQEDELIPEEFREGFERWKLDIWMCCKVADDTRGEIECYLVAEESEMEAQEQSIRKRFERALKELRLADVVIAGDVQSARPQLVSLTQRLPRNEVDEEF